MYRKLLLEDAEGNQEVVATSAQKILDAATKLFALKSFASVSIKEIATLSGLNSALISYYYGGKKNLYQEVLNTQADLFIKLQNKILNSDLPPLEKLEKYADDIAELQAENPYCIHLIFREFFSPAPMFESYIKKRLFKVHQFMAELVNEAMEKGDMPKDIMPTHVAFTLESIIIFFFMTKKHIPALGNFDEEHVNDYLKLALQSYLKALRK